MREVRKKENKITKRLVKESSVNNKNSDIMDYDKSTIVSNNNANVSNWDEWLAGIIDAVGIFKITKKNNITLIIRLEASKYKYLEQIKNKLGGSIKSYAGGHAYVYSLHSYFGIKNVIHKVNGNIRKEKRQLEFIKLCKLYKILYKVPGDLQKNNGWICGFVQALIQQVRYDTMPGQQYIIKQKKVYFLQKIKKLFGGEFYISEQNCFFRLSLTEEIFQEISNIK